MENTPKKLARLLSVAILSLAAQLASALSVTELPIKEFAGKRYYCYEVKSKETIYAISRKLNLTQDEILKFNPSAYDGLRPNSQLFFPVEAFLAPEAQPSTSSKGKPEMLATKSYDDDNTTTSAAPHASTYVVQKGETLYGISNRYGITVEELMEANPATRSGLKSGMTLVIPSPASKDEAPVLAQESHAGEAESARPTVGYTPETTHNAPYTPVADAVEATRNADRNINIALLLPFDLDADTQDRQAQNALEYYKGFLMAVDTLRDFKERIHITTIDVGKSEAAFSKALADPRLREAQVIVAPDDRDGRFAKLAEWGLRNDVFIFNNFVVRDESYLTNPKMIQANVPHDIMFEKAVSGLIDNRRRATPVILSPSGASADKLEFINMLTAQLKQQDIPFRTISYTGALTAANLKDLDSDDDYIFVAPPSSQRDLNRLLPVLIEFKENAAGRMKLFGYPEWIIFRGETKDNMHKMETSIYSRFILDPDDRYTANLMGNFKGWYGHAMNQAVPPAAITGFDSGMFLLRALEQGHGELGSSSPSYQGVQNGYKLRKGAAGEYSGLCNERLFLVNFRPSGTIDYKDL